MGAKGGRVIWGISVSVTTGEGVFEVNVLLLDLGPAWA